MKAHYTTPNKRLTFEIEGSRGEILAKLAAIQDLFDEACCGICGADAVFTKRNHDDYTFYGMKCCNGKCGAQLDIGETKEHDFWVKRWDKEKKCPMPARGWYIYQRGPGGGSKASAPADGDSAPSDSSDIPF